MRGQALFRDPPLTLLLCVWSIHTAVYRDLLCLPGRGFQKEDFVSKELDWDILEMWVCIARHHSLERKVEMGVVYQVSTARKKRGDLLM